MTLAVALTALLAAAPAKDSPVLKDGDRVVFFGDSITVQHTYMRYVEAYLRLRHPDWTITFINAGVGGNTALDALARLDVDVLTHRPTVVVVNFGMNDAGYATGSEGAAFERNMQLVLERLDKAHVRTVVWADPTPYDVEGLGPKNFNRGRQTRLEELTEFVHTTAADQHRVVTEWQKPVQDALGAWKTAGRPERLIPDRIHPGPLVHAVMAASLLKALGFDVSAPTVHGAFKAGELKLDGASAAVSWDGTGPVTLDLAAAPAPVPLVMTAKDCDALGNADVSALRRLVLKLDGLPGDRYRLKLGDVDLGRVTAKELAKGFDLMTLAAPRPLVPPDARLALSQCKATTGNPFVRDYECLTDLLFEKDQLRITMRPEKTRGLPDFVPEYLEEYQALQEEWEHAVEKEIATRAKAMRATPHELVLTPEPVVNAQK